jgi:hypothetical protein
MSYPTKAEYENGGISFSNLAAFQTGEEPEKAEGVRGMRIPLA